MSGPYEVNHIHEPLVGVCIGYVDDFTSNTISVLDFYPLYITFAIGVMMLVHFQVFHWIWSCVLFSDMALNTLFRLLVGPSDNLQPPSCPIRQEQMPALGAQEITALLTTGLGLLALMRPMRTRCTVVVPLVTLGTVLIYTRIYLIFNTTAQILAGAAIGYLEGICFLVIIYNLQKWRWLNRIIKIPELFWLGQPIDTMTDPRNPTICLEDEFESLTVLVYEKK